MAASHKGDKYGKSLLVDSKEDVDNLVGGFEQDNNFDDNEDIDEEIVIRDEGPLLVVRRV